MSRDFKKPDNPAFANGKHRKSLPRFDGYTGGKTWTVARPNFGDCMVVAPSFQAAIVVAARVWKQTWTKIDFYADCKVIFKGDRKKLELPGSAVV